MVRVEEACVHRVVVVGIVDSLVLLVEVDSFVEDIGDDHNVDLPVVDVECKLVVARQELVGHTFALSQVRILVVAAVPVVVLDPEVVLTMVEIRLKQDLGTVAVGIEEDFEIVVEIVEEVDEKVDEKVVDEMVDEGVGVEYEEVDEVIDAKVDGSDESLDEVFDELDKRKM